MKIISVLLLIMCVCSIGYAELTKEQEDYVIKKYEIEKLEKEVKELELQKGQAITVEYQKYDAAVASIDQTYDTLIDAKYAELETKEAELETAIVVIN